MQFEENIILNDKIKLFEKEKIRKIVIYLVDYDLNLQPSYSQVLSSDCEKISITCYFAGTMIAAVN